ncbi:dihydrodipicolinate synthase family protein [Salinisphaera sp. SWV1]|uniref:dihydrodipicolinate synthase family protein n=1 Tax=Salinisphaera sp. SWV1 TaxID=3454139 RepID=UPI003F84036F
MEASVPAGEILSPVITPFDRDLSPDVGQLTAQCRWLLDNGVGLAVFGTNSEASSMSLREKLRLLDHLAGAGLPGERMMPGTGACSIDETVALSRQALAIGAE